MEGYADMQWHIYSAIVNSLSNAKTCIQLAHPNIHCPNCILYGNFDILFTDTYILNADKLIVQVCITASDFCFKLDANECLGCRK